MGFVANFAEGFMGYQQAQGEAAQYKFNARSEQIAADQDSVNRLADLNSSLSSINAVRTSRNLDVASPTGLAIAADYTKRAQQGIDTSRLNYLTRAQSDLFGASQAQYKGYAALIGSFLKTGDEFAQAFAAGGGG